MKFLITVIVSLTTLTAAYAQYAPQAGVSGTTAIPSSSTSFVGWATGCTVQRGYIDIADKPQGHVTAGTDANAVGVADQSIVSLGDSGVAVLSFGTALFNGPGADFAVFENGFSNPSDSERAFLELAFVEVSSNGVDYFRFPAHSLTPATPQIPGAGVFMDAKLINNLAGKYISGYGTPFDLEDLAGTTGLDVNYISHIRLVDVVGFVNANLGSIDTANNIINDPYPTNFPTGGFDLDAVGAIHQYSASVSSTEANTPFVIYPNPVTDRLWIKSNRNERLSVILSDITGKKLWSGRVDDQGISLDGYQPGIYYIQIQNEDGGKWQEKIIKR